MDALRGRAAALVVLVVGAGCIGLTPEDRARAALPDDRREEGPLHRAGQPCLLCHGGYGGGEPRFSVAGTVYDLDGVTGREGIEVLLVDVLGDEWVGRTNEVGNFYVEQSEWDPVFPLTADVSDGENFIGMRTPISREGSCAHCHGPQLSATSVGPVIVGHF